MDGTLLNSNKNTSKENIMAVKAAINKGIQVIICSGRVFSGAKAFAKLLDLEGPIITCNGALIKDLKTEEVLYSNYMKKEDCLKIVEICHEFGVYFHTFIENTLYTEKLAYSSLFYWNKNKEVPESDRIGIELVSDMTEIIQATPHSILKFIIISEDPEVLIKCRSKVGEIPSVSLTSSDSNNFEVMNKGVNKGNGIRVIAQKFNVEKEEIMAIGDNENDLDMFEAAGFKVAMGNAEEKVKAVADFITLSNDEHGVEEAIKRFVL